MPKKITLIHTADVHRATFSALKDRIAPELELVQHVRTDWLDRARKNESLSLHDLKLHILSKGCSFDIHERKPYPPKKRGSK